MNQKSKTVTLTDVKSEKIYRFSIFKTSWGWFGLLASGKGLIRSCLPMDDQQTVKLYLLYGLRQAVLDEAFFSTIENEVKAYYEGQKPDFNASPVDLEGMSAFQQSVLTALRNVNYGQTTTYAQLAETAGNPKAARAIGGVMAKNPLPLIIPCHRVMGANGKPTGFSASGGIQTKLRMLQLEKSS